MERLYDIVIVGAGPAGLTAGIYGARGGMKTLLLDNKSTFSEAFNTLEIENYPAFNSVGGKELVDKMKAQCLDKGCEIERVDSIAYSLSAKQLTLGSGNVIIYKKLILALGASPKAHPALENFTARGVSYCATCDGGFTRGKTVMVVGGGDTALTDALYLSGLAQKVYLVHRRDALRARAALVNKVLAKDNIEVLYNSHLVGAVGEKKLEQVIIATPLGQRHIDIFKLFIAIGVKANSQSFTMLDNDNGFIITDERMHTSMENVFAVGDMRRSPLRQIVTACADGAIAAETAIHELLAY